MDIMKKLFLVLLLVPVVAVSQPRTHKEPTGVAYDTRVVRVIDGDTVVVAAGYLPAPLKPELSVRIYGVDTPESGSQAKCPAEAALATRAKQWTQRLITQGKDHKLILYKWDKYGGRVIGDIVVDGQSVRRGLIAAGLAREYYGKAKISWCN